MTGIVTWIHWRLALFPGSPACTQFIALPLNLYSQCEFKGRAIIECKGAEPGKEAN